MTTLRVANLPSNAMAFRNALFVNTTQSIPIVTSERIFVALPECKDTPVMEVIRDDTVAVGEIAMSGLVRQFLSVSTGQTIKLEAWDARMFKRLEAVSITCEVQLISKRPISVKESEFAAFLVQLYKGQMLHVGQSMVVDYQQRAFKLVITATEVPNTTLDSVGVSSFKAILNEDARFSLYPVKDSLLEWKANDVGVSKLQPTFHFRDLGIGGLDKEFAATFRRAFASRMYPPAVIKRLGIQHVKGILLYGPPGTGKTLIARKIGSVLRGREPKIVNGPEVMSKYVGESEKNIRELFADAIADQQANGENSDLHIIILDEVDAICRARGTTSGGTGVQDTMVNQLLSMIDGVNALNNVLIIGMTNRLDMIDEALLRPGRLEVHLEISLPDHVGRVQIFDIHTKQLQEQKCLASDVNSEEMAGLMKNYSGAEIAGVVRGAVMSSLFGSIRGDVTGDFKIPEKLNDVVVSKEHFLMALEDIRPAFGIDETEMTAFVRHPLIDFSFEYHNMMEKLEKVITQVRESKNTSLLSVLLEGAHSSGKTAVACQAALQSKFPFAKLITPENMVGLSEQAKCSKIVKIFEDAYRSSLSLIVLDNLERLLDYVPIGQRFSNAVLQTLLVLVKKAPRVEGRRLMIIATGTNKLVLEEMELAQAFDVQLTVPEVLLPTQAESVFRSIPNTLSDELIRNICEHEVPFPIGIKKLLVIIDMFLLESEQTPEVFRECVNSFGVRN